MQRAEKSNGLACNADVYCSFQMLSFRKSKRKRPYCPHYRIIGKKLFGIVCVCLIHTCCWSIRFVWQWDILSFCFEDRWRKRQDRESSSKDRTIHTKPWRADLKSKLKLIWYIVDWLRTGNCHSRTNSDLPYDPENQTAWDGIMSIHPPHHVVP